MWLKRITVTFLKEVLRFFAYSSVMLLVVGYLAVTCFGTGSVPRDLVGLETKIRNIVFTLQTADNLLSDPEAFRNFLGFCRLHKIPLAKGAPFADNPEYLDDQQNSAPAPTFFSERKDSLAADLANLPILGEKKVQSSVPEKKEEMTIQGDPISYFGESEKTKYAITLREGGTIFDEGTRFFRKKEKNQWEEFAPVYRAPKGEKGQIVGVTVWHPDQGPHGVALRKVGAATEKEEKTKH